MNNHLTQEQFIGYIHHTLTDAEREELDQHLASCAQCRALLTEHETVQRRIRYDLSSGLKKVHPSNKMSFSAISPRLRRRRGWSFLLAAIDQPLSSAVALGMLALLVLALFAVSSNPVSLPLQIVSNPTPELATVVFAHHPYDKAYYAGLIEEFNQLYPHITIRQFVRPYQTTDGHIVPDGPDVILDWQYNLAALQAEHELLDLTPYYEQGRLYQKYDFYLHAIDLFKYEDRLWAIPISIEPMVMYYNKDLFDQHGLLYPKTGWTWHDFETIVNTLNNPETRVVGYAPMGEKESYIDLFILIHQNGGRVYEGTPMAQRPGFDDPLTVEAVAWYIELLSTIELDHISHLQHNYTGYGPKYFPGVLANKAGMWMGPPSLGVVVGQDYWKMNWGVAPLPRQVKLATSGWLDGVAIAADTENPEAAWRWVDFLSRQLPHQKVPARYSLLKSDAYEQMAGSEMAAVTREAMLYIDLLSPELSARDKTLSHIFVNAITDILAGRDSPPAALQQAQQAAEEVLKSELILDR
jgi:multiple sugar transport system substrate-binding protein